ncbi:MAG: hypothetical protein AB7I27_10545 [Bacteriovoracaceae bacterium]
MKIVLTTKIDSNYLQIKNGFNQKLFSFLAPPFMPFSILRFDGVRKDDVFHLSMMKGEWKGHITEEKQNDEEWYFIDEGIILPWPLTKWRHKHRVIRVSENESIIRDEISFQTSSSLFDLLFYPLIWVGFALRPVKYGEYFEV